MTHCWPLPRLMYDHLSDLEETRPVDLFVSAGIIDVVAPLVSLPIERVHEVTEATLSHWDELARGLCGEVVYSIGGGLAVDAAKFAAAKRGHPHVCVPSALSVDAFFTWASGYREDGCVRYVETRPPDSVLIDLSLIAAGPLTIRSAGVTDVLSIATGSHDWRLAHEAGRNPAHMPYDAPVAHMAASILEACLGCAASAGRGEPAGLRRLAECLAMEVCLCNLVGHARPEEGSEHYFAYAVESVMGKGLPHGDLVGPGILIMAHLQGQDIGPLKEAMRAANVPLTNIPPEVIRRVLEFLPTYCEQHNLPYGIAHTLTPEVAARFDPAILG